MEELRNALNELYDRFGYNEVTVALSQILDRYIAQKQLEEFEKWKYTNKLQKIQM